jgi:hypothetical protein
VSTIADINKALIGVALTAYQTGVSKALDKARFAAKFERQGARDFHRVVTEAAGLHGKTAAEKLAVVGFDLSTISLTEAAPVASEVN